MAQLAKNVSFRNNTSWTSLLDMIYPKGSYYYSNSSTNPASLFGGGWTAVTGRFPYMNAGTGTGGENTHKLTTSEMPSHNHYAEPRVVIWYPDGQPNFGSQRLINYWNGCVNGNNSPDSYGEGKLSFYTNNVGGGDAHNNMPAYKTVYAWYRTS